MLDWLSEFHSQLVRNPGTEKLVYDEHRVIFEKIEARDPDGAAEAMTVHLTRANQRYQISQQ